MFYRWRQPESQRCDRRRKVRRQKRRGRRQRRRRSRRGGNVKRRLHYGENRSELGRL
jgi:hypothetical protein